MSEQHDNTQPQAQPGEQPPVDEHAVEKTEAKAESQPEAPAAETVMANSESSVEGAPDSAPNAAKTAPESSDKCQLVFHAFAKIGPLVLLIALALMSWPDFLHPEKALYCPAESKYISAFLSGIANHSWLAPTALDNGQWALPQWPVFYWFTALLAFIPQVAESGLLLPISSFLCVLLAVIAVWAYALAAGFGIRAALAAGLILLCCPIFAPLPHFFGPAALASGLLALALLFFARGWNSQKGWFSLPCAFVFTILAGLCGGLFYLLIPLIASFFYLLWTGRVGRAHRWDAMCGFILMLIVGGGWLALLMLDGNHGQYIAQLFSADANFSIPLQSCWWMALLLAGIGMLPWLLEIFGVSWLRVLSQAGKTLAASRHDNASAMVWISVVVAGCLSIFAVRGQVAAVAIACLCAPLLGKAFVNLPRAGNRLLSLLIALGIIAAGLIMLAAGFSATEPWLWSISGFTPAQAIRDILPTLTSLPIIGGICLAGGLVMLVLFVRRYRDGGVLVFSTVLTIIICQPALLMLVPELSNHAESRLEKFEAIENRVGALLAGAPLKAKPEEQKVDEAAPQEATPAQPEAVAPEKSQPETQENAVQTPPAAIAPEVPAESTAPAPEATPDTSDSDKGEVEKRIIIIEEKAAGADLPPDKAPEPEPANP